MSAGLNFTGQIARAAAPVVQSVVKSVGNFSYEDKTTNITAFLYGEPNEICLNWAG